MIVGSVNPPQPASAGDQLTIVDWHMLPTTGGHPKPIQKGSPVQVWIKLRNNAPNAAEDVIIDFKIYNTLYGINSWVGWIRTGAEIREDGDTREFICSFGPFLAASQYVLNSGVYKITQIRVAARDFDTTSLTIADPYDHFQISQLGGARVVFAYAMYDQALVDHLASLGGFSYDFLFDYVTDLFRDCHIEDEFNIDFRVFYGMWNPGVCSPDTYTTKLKQTAGNNLNLGHDWVGSLQIRTTNPGNHGFDAVWGVTGHYTYHSNVLGRSGQNWAWASSGWHNAIKLPHTDIILWWEKRMLAGVEMVHVSQHELSHLFNAPDNCGHPCVMDDWDDPYPYNWCDSCEDVIASHQNNYW